MFNTLVSFLHFSGSLTASVACSLRLLVAPIASSSPLASRRVAVVAAVVAGVPLGPRAAGLAARWRGRRPLPSPPSA